MNEKLIYDCAGSSNGHFVGTRFDLIWSDVRVYPTADCDVCVYLLRVPHFLVLRSVDVCEMEIASFRRRRLRKNVKMPNENCLNDLSMVQRPYSPPAFKRTELGLNSLERDPSKIRCAIAPL